MTPKFLSANTAVAAALLGAGILATAPVQAAPSCKNAIASARGELLVCKQGGSNFCTFPKYDALTKDRKRCLKGSEGKSLIAFHGEVLKAIEGRRAELEVQGKLQAALDSVKLARVEELADTMQVANGAKAALKAHQTKFGSVSAEATALDKKLDAALASRQTELNMLAKKTAFANKSIVKTGRYTADDALRPAKVAEAWTLASRDRMVKVAGQMNSSLQKFVWSPSDNANAQVAVKGDRSGPPSFQLKMVDDKASMQVVIGWAASTSIGTPLLIWDAPLDKDYFLGVTPDGARFRVPYVTTDGPRTYKTVEPLGSEAKPRFKPFRQMKVPNSALADLARVGVLTADTVTAFAAASTKAETCYGKIIVKLQNKATALYSANKTEAADKIKASMPDKALAKCKRHIKPVTKLYNKLMKQYWLARVAGFEQVKTMFTAPK